MRLNFLLIFIPLILGLTISRLCPIRTTSPNNKSPQNFPQPWVFGVAWTTIYLLFGITWFKNYQIKSTPYWLLILFPLNILFNLSWIYINNCLNDQKNAIFIYLPLFITLLPLMINSPWELTSLSLAPYFAWLILAIILNYSSVFLTYKN